MQRASLDAAWRKLKLEPGALKARERATIGSHGLIGNDKTGLILHTGDVGPQKCIMETIMSEIKHYLNPLHVYCRLRDIGVSKCRAQFVCRLYEKVLFKRFVCRQDP